MEYLIAEITEFTFHLTSTRISLTAFRKTFQFISHASHYTTFKHSYAIRAAPARRSEYKVGNRVSLNVLRTGSVSSKNKRQPTEQYVSPKNIAAIRGQTVEIWCIYGGT